MNSSSIKAHGIPSLARDSRIGTGDSNVEGRVEKKKKNVDDDNMEE